MDGTRFDAWTRRRVAVAAGGGIALALGLTTGHARKTRKRCVKVLKPCHQGGKKCCHHNACRSFDEGSDGSFFCCKGAGKSCTGGECCPPLLCVKIVGQDAGACREL